MGRGGAGGLGDVHRIVDPDGAVEGFRAKAAPWGGGGKGKGVVCRWLPRPFVVRGRSRGPAAAREEALDATHEDVER